MLFSLSRITGNVRAGALSFQTLHELAAYLDTISYPDGIAPALFRNDYREKGNFLEASVIVLDIDGTLPDLNALQAKLGQYSYVIKESRNHMREKHTKSETKPALPRYHAFLFMEKPVTNGSEYEAKYRGLQKLLDIELDPSCIDCARQFYGSGKVVAVQEGKFIDPVAVSVPDKPKKLINPPEGPRQSVRPWYADKIVNGLKSKSANEVWHPTFIKLALEMKQQQWPMEDAAANLALFSLNSGFDGTLDEDDEKQLLDVYLNRAVYPPHDENLSLPARFLADYGTEIRYWQKRFYFWDGTRYKEKDREILKAELVRYLQISELVEPDKLNSYLIDWIILHLTGLTFVDQEQDTSHIAFQNGHLALSDIEAGHLELKKPDPSILGFTALPYEYDPNASCPSWTKFIAETLPDLDSQQFIQEWFGYNIMPAWTANNKSLLMEGKGANGKSVVCTVLRQLLGPENVSHVNLEAFTAERTFPLAVMFGKLANIVEDMNEIQKVNEGILKQLTGGNPITVEQKNKDPFTLIPTAKLTFATNVMPRFTDRTDAIWRRLIILPFTKQILDESKQDKRLVTTRYWKKELPGICNWALEGLLRLIKRGHFIEPKVAQIAKAKYKLDMNPARQFLEDYERMPGKKISKQELFNAYKEYCKNTGYNHTGINKFHDAVLDAFPGIEDGRGSKGIRYWFDIAPLSPAEDATYEAKFTVIK